MLVLLPLYKSYNPYKASDLQYPYRVIVIVMLILYQVQK
jgi:hypothetical protein